MAWIVDRLGQHPEPARLVLGQRSPRAEAAQRGGCGGRAPRGLVQAGELGLHVRCVRAQLRGARQLGHRRLRVAEAYARRGEPHPGVEGAPVVARRPREGVGGLRVVGEAGAQLAEEEPGGSVLGGAGGGRLRGGERLVLLALRAEGAREAEPQRRRLGRERDRGVEVGLGALRVALGGAAPSALAEQLDEPPRHVRACGIEAPGTLQRGDRRALLPGGGERQAVAGGDPGVVGARAVGAPERGQALARLLEALAGRGEGEQRADVALPQRDRALQRLARLARLAERQPELAEGAPRVRVVRREAHHLAVARRGLGHAPPRQQRRGEGRVRVEPPGVDRDRAAQHRHRLVGLAERQVRVARAHQGLDGVDAVPQGELVRLRRPARVAVRGEHAAEEQRRVTSSGARASTSRVVAAASCARRRDA